MSEILRIPLPNFLCDHNAILVKPYVHRSQKPNNGRMMKRDLRNSRCYVLVNGLSNLRFLNL